MTHILVLKYYHHPTSSHGRGDEGLCWTCKSPKLIHISSTATYSPCQNLTSHSYHLGSLGSNLGVLECWLSMYVQTMAQVHTSQWSGSSEGNLASAFKKGSLATAPALSLEVEEQQPLPATNIALLPQEYEVNFLPGLLPNAVMPSIGHASTSV